MQSVGSPSTESRSAHAGRPRMEDIAARIGVSKSTVSRALRNDARISVAMRRRIARAARDLGYRKNPLVAALMADIRAVYPAKKHATTIAFFIPADNAAVWFKVSAYVDFLDGARRRCDELGFQLDTIALDACKGKISQVTRVLRTRGIRGVVVGPHRLQAPPVGPDWDVFWQSFSFALLGVSFAHVPLHRASSHHYLCMLNGLQALTRLGYQRVALANHADMDDRYMHQFVGAAGGHATEVPPARRVPPLLAKTLNRETCLRWFEKYRPDAILSGEPLITGWLESAGIKIPRDVGYAVTNNQGHAHIAGIDQRLPIVGANATDLVATQLYHNETGLPPHQLLVLSEGMWVDGPTAPGKAPHPPTRATPNASRRPRAGGTRSRATGCTKKTG
ncbi:MAG: LacI family DNA-binding transcriptional regulator [Candidatus Marinimicrobia bacterium]|nr:LacI family DNA-binding transcriptional regulator [Candidatus Neomarinimicrobiota bacterium]